MEFVGQAEADRAGYIKGLKDAQQLILEKGKHQVYSVNTFSNKIAVELQAKINAQTAEKK